MSKNGDSTKPKNDEISNPNQSIRCIICGEINNRFLANHFGISHMGLGAGTLALAVSTPSSSNQPNRQLLNISPGTGPGPKNHVLALNRAATLRVAAGPRRFLPQNVTTIITPRPRPTLPTLGQFVECEGETVSQDNCMPLINQLDRPILEVIYVDDSDDDDDDDEDLDLTLSTLCN